MIKSEDLLGPRSRASLRRGCILLASHTHRRHPPLSDEDNAEDGDGTDLEMRQGAGGALIASDSIKI